MVNTTINDLAHQAPRLIYLDHDTLAPSTLSDKLTDLPIGELNGSRCFTGRLWFNSLTAASRNDSEHNRCDQQNSHRPVPRR